MISFIKKNWFILLLLLFSALVMYPTTGLPIKVFFQRLLMSAPSEVSEKYKKSLLVYNWELNSLDGTAYNFNDSEERVTLVNFWATWCPPCVAEMPTMQNLYNEYGDRVDFYFVTSEDPAVVTRFMEKKGYNFPVYIEKQPPPSLLRVTTIPTTFVLSKNGEIKIRETGAAKWDSDEVRTLLGALLSQSN